MTKSQRGKYIKRVFSGTEVGVLVEHFEGQVNLIGEQHSDLVKDIKGIKSGLGEFRNEMYDFRDEMYDFRDEMYDFRDETRENFKLVMEQLSRIEDDFLDLRKRIDKIDKEKVSIKEFNWLKSKVLEIEDRLEKCKKQQTALAAKN
jgi:chromosome segregation ATPase